MTSQMAAEEDEDLRAAIALSLEESHHVLNNSSTTNMPSQRLEDTSTDRSSAKPTTGIARLDRKAMEAERLARIARKRERSISPPPLSSRKSPKLESSTVSLPSGARLTSFASIVDQDQRGRKSATANAANQQLRQVPTTAATSNGNTESIIKVGTSDSQPVLKFPNGVVKRTWAFGFERGHNDVKLEEVLEATTLRTAVLSAFQWDVKWLLPKLKTPVHGGTTKCIFVMQAKTNEERDEYRRQSKDMSSFLRLVFPPMYAPINCMHSKLMLLFHESKLRIAIPTANLLNFDWGETGVMENSVFMIDLPRIAEGEGGKNELTSFGKELLHFLEKQEFPRDVRNGLLNFDFSATHDMRFIHTAGGTHFGEDAGRTGLLGLSRAVRQLRLESQQDLEIDFAASSIGSLNDAYLRCFHSAARGEDLISQANATNAKAKADFFKKPAPSANGSTNIRDQVRIYFPTHDTVRSSRAGSAGTICLSRKWFEAAPFPRAAFRDYRSIRTGLLSHNKILYARGKKGTTSGKANSGGSSEDIAWAYVGSANMSESAWGKLIYDNKAKAWKISCRNWECGVLLPVPKKKLSSIREVKLSSIKKEIVAGEDSETESEDEGDSAGRTRGTSDIVGIGVFQDVVEPPFEIPGAKYEGKQPWYFLEREE